jgi:hypothetical protein
MADEPKNPPKKPFSRTEYLRHKAEREARETPNEKAQCEADASASLQKAAEKFARDRQLVSNVFKQASDNKKARGGDRSRRERGDKSEPAMPRSHRVSRILAGGLFALFFGALIQALTLFGVITMNSGHLFMVIAFLAGALLLTTEILPVKPRKHKILSVVILAVALLAIDLASAFYASHQKNVTPTSSPAPVGFRVELPRMLIPAAEPNPSPSWCLDSAPPDAVGVFIGSTVVITTKSSFPIEIGDKPVFTIHRSESGIELTAQVIDRDSGVRTQITNNQVDYARTDNPLTSTSESAHSLLIENSYGLEMLYAHFYNKRAIRIRGRFYVPGCRNAVIITDKDVILNGIPVPTRGVCLEDFSNAIAAPCD